LLQDRQPLEEERFCPDMAKGGRTGAEVLAGTSGNW